GGSRARHAPDTPAAPLVAPADERLAAVAAVLAESASRRAGAAVLGGIPSGWRNVPTSPQRSVLTGPGGEHQVSYRFTRAGVTVDGLPNAVLLSLTADSVIMDTGGLIRRWRIARYPGPDGGRRLDVDGDTGHVTFVE